MRSASLLASSCITLQNQRNLSGLILYGAVVGADMESCAGRDGGLPLSDSRKAAIVLTSTCKACQVVPRFGYAVRYSARSC